MPRTSIARPLTAVLAAVIAAGALAGCTASSTPGYGCGPDFTSGDASSTVTATGDVGEAPAVDFPTPLIDTKPQVTVLTEGHGDTVERYDAVSVELTVWEGTKTQSQATPYDGTAASRPVYIAGEDAGAFGDALVCAKVGTRLALVAPSEMFSADYDPTAKLSGQVQVVVVDIMDAWAGKAEGFNQLPLDGMPTVVTAVDGTPGVSVLAQAPPTKVRTSLIKAGSGAKLASGDTALLQFRQWSWSAEGSVSVGSTDTWVNHSPAVIKLDASAQQSASLPKEFFDALDGVKVGSQVLLVIPDEKGTATIWVIDVLGVLDAK